MTIYFLPAVEKITVGIFEDREGELFEAGEYYPGIVFSYSDAATLALTQLMLELNVKRGDLSIVNFEELKNRFNVVVSFDIKRGRNKYILTAEVEIDKKTVADFKKHLQRTKSLSFPLGFSVLMM